MTHTDRIAQMALEAGLVDYVTEQGQLITDYGTINEELRNFARLVAEDCAKVAEMADTGALSKGDIEFNTQRGHDAAQAIRSRYSTLNHTTQPDS